MSKLGNKTYLSLLTVSNLISSAFGGIATVMMGSFMDLATKGDIDALIQGVGPFMFLVCGVMLIGIVNNHLQKMYMQKSMTALKETYVHQLMQKDVISMGRIKNSKYISNLTNDADRLEKDYYEGVMEVVSMITRVLVTLYILWTINVWFLALALLLFAIFGTLSRKSGKSVKETEAQKSESLLTYTAFMEETVEGFDIIKQHQLEATRYEKMLALSQAVQNDDHKVQVKSTWVDFKNGLFQSIVITGLVLSGLMVTVLQGLSTGTLMVIILAFSELLWPFQAIIPIITKMSGIETVFDDYETSLAFTPDVREVKTKGFDSLSFEHVDFGYDYPILNDVSMDIKNGEKILIVGPSGQGKSTFLKTVRQSLAPLNGTISMNGHDQASIDLNDYMSTFSVVDQHGYIFAGTVASNISLFQNKGDIRPFLEKVGLGSLNPDLVLLNDGSNLSGGQRARLLLARALYFNAPVVVLDEIFASLDRDVACAIEADVLSINQTILNVSHIVFAENLDAYDRFFIVDQGKVDVTRDKALVLSRMLEAHA